MCQWGTDSSSQILYSLNLFCVAVFIFNKILKNERDISRLPSALTSFNSSIRKTLRGYYFVSGISLCHLIFWILWGRDQSSEDFRKHILIFRQQWQWVSLTLGYFWYLINLSLKYSFQIIHKTKVYLMPAIFNRFEMHSYGVFSF